jgi:hypothetical protein
MTSGVKENGIGEFIKKDCIKKNGRIARIIYESK